MFEQLESPLTLLIFSNFKRVQRPPIPFPSNPLLDPSASLPFLAFPTTLQRQTFGHMCTASLPAGLPVSKPHVPAWFGCTPLAAGNQSQGHLEGAVEEGREGLCYLLPLEHMSEGSHLAVLVCPKDLAQRAGGHFAVQAVDVDAFLFMLLAPGLVGLLFWSERR